MRFLRTASALLAMLVLTGAWLMPGHYLPWPTFQTQAVASVGVFLLWVCALANRCLPKIDGVVVALMSLAVVPLFQWHMGIIVFVADAVVPSVLIALGAITFAVGKSLRDVLGTHYLYFIFAGLIAAATASVALQWMQWLAIPWLGVLLSDLALPLRPYANLAQPNHLGTLLVVALAGVMYMYCTRVLRGLTLTCLTAWILSGVIMTQSRTAWLQLTLLTGFAICWGVREKRARDAYLYALIYVLFIVAALAWIPLNEALLLAPARVEIGERLHAGTRLEYWPVLGRAVLERPWAGWGWNQVGAAQHAMAEGGAAGYELLGSAHNIILDIALQAGVPVAILTTSAGAWWICRHFSFSPVGMAAVAVLLILCHAMTEYPLEHAHFLILIALLMSAVDEAPALVWKISSMRVEIMSGVVFATVFLFAGCIGIEYLAIERSDRDARFALLFGVPAGAVIEPPRVELLDGLREYHRFRFTPARSGMSESELEWMRQVAHRYPHPPAILRLALAEGLNEKSDRAQAELRALCHADVPVRCDEARLSWGEVQRRYPHLPSFPRVTEAPTWWRRWAAPH